MKLTKRIKKSLHSGFFWGIQAVLFGLVLGLPFIVARNTYLSWWINATLLDILVLLISTAIAGFVIEYIIKKAKLV